jgi:hypothetical protein
MRNVSQGSHPRYPGLDGIRGLQQDEFHKRSIASLEEKHIDSVTAALILIDGTVPRSTVGIVYALSTLSAVPGGLRRGLGSLMTSPPAVTGVSSGIVTR